MQTTRAPLAHLLSRLLASTRFRCTTLFVRISSNAESARRTKPTACARLNWSDSVNKRSLGRIKRQLLPVTGLWLWLGRQLQRLQQQPVQQQQPGRPQPQLVRQQSRPLQLRGQPPHRSLQLQLPHQPQWTEAQRPCPAVELTSPPRTLRPPPQLLQQPQQLLGAPHQERPRVRRAPLRQPLRRPLLAQVLRRQVALQHLPSRTRNTRRDRTQLSMWRKWWRHFAGDIQVS